jgi:hypothetical protein
MKENDLRSWASLLDVKKTSKRSVTGIVNEIDKILVLASKKSIRLSNTIKNYKDRKTILSNAGKAEMLNHMVEIAMTIPLKSRTKYGNDPTDRSVKGGEYSLGVIASTAKNLSEELPALIISAEYLLKWIKTKTDKNRVSYHTKTMRAARSFFENMHREVIEFMKKQKL